LGIIPVERSPTGRPSAGHRPLGDGVDAPKAVSAFGGKYVIEDNSEIPDTLEVVFEYPASPVSGKEFVVTWSNRHANSHGPDGHNYGIQFYGSEARCSSTARATRCGLSASPTEAKAFCPPV